MSLVGIIANPAAGKDVRRLVAHASTFDNQQKINIVRRVLLALDAVGVGDVALMPDSFAIGERALDGLKLSLAPRFLDMQPDFTQADSMRAAAALLALGAGCIVTLGGDGTNRMVARACGDVPLTPISTGTNNVFPTMVEGTLAGLAAGLVARGLVSGPDVITRRPRLELVSAGEIADIALIDVVVSEGQFVGARALWDISSVRQIVLCRAEPHSIGFAAIGGNLAPFAPANGHGLALEIGGHGLRVLAPIAPGLVHWVPVASHHALPVGDSVEVAHTPCVLALDGERERVLRAGERVSIRLSAEGPYVVDIPAALQQAARTGFFVQSE